MVAKAARVKQIPFTCERTDPSEKQFFNHNFSNPGSGLYENIQNPKIKKLRNYISNVGLFSFYCRYFKMFKFVIFGANQGLICCHANRGETVSMCHFKEIDFWLKNIYLFGIDFRLKWT